MFNSEELQIIYEALCYHADGEGHHNDAFDYIEVECLIGKVLEYLDNDQENAMPE